MMKRGISPLIATILIIGFVVVISGVVVIWGGGFVKSSTEETGEIAMHGISCLEDVDVEIENACDLNGAVMLNIKNNDKTEVSKFIVKTNLGSGETTEGVKPYSGNNIGAAIIDFENLEEGESFETLEITPIVLDKGEEVVCKGLCFKHNDIKEGVCNLREDSGGGGSFANVIARGGFESGNEGDVQESGDGDSIEYLGEELWEATNRPYMKIFLSNESHTGLKSLKGKRLYSTPGTGRGGVSHNFGNLPHGRKFILSFYYKCDSSVGNFNNYLCSAGTGNECAFNDAEAHKQSECTGKWEKIVMKMPIISENIKAEWVVLGRDLHKDEIVYFDDVQFYCEDC